MFIHNFSVVPLFLLHQIGCVRGTHSGVKMQLTQSGLEYVAGVTSMILRRNILDKNLGNVTGDSGDLEYAVSNVKITDYAQRSSLVRIDPSSSTISWNLALDNLKTSADWNYKFNLGIVKLKDSGSLTLEGRDLSITLSVSFGFDPSTGTATLRTTSCRCTILDIKLEFYGRNRSLYNILSSVFKDGIRGTVEDELCESARDEIDDTGNEELSTLDVDVRLDSDLYFDYRLTSHPVIKDGYIETSHAGAAFGGSFPREPLRNDQPEMDERPGDEMVSFLISEDSLTSYGRILISKGTRTLITRDDLQEDQKEFLDTDCEEVFCFVEMMPDLPSLYPHATIEVDYKVSEYPALSIRTSGISSNVSGAALIHVRLENGSKLHLASTEVHLVVNVTAKIEGHLLTLKVLGVTPYISIEERVQSGIDETGLNHAMVVLSKIMMARVNRDLGEGMPVIKTRGVAWENTRIQFYDRFIRLAADLKYLKI